MIFVLAEAVPKTYALLATERAALRVTPLVQAIAFLGAAAMGDAPAGRRGERDHPGPGRAEGPMKA